MAIGLVHEPNVSTNYYKYATVPLSSFPCTVAAWVYPTDTRDNDWNILQIQDDASSSNYMRLNLSENIDAGVVGRIQIFVNPAAGGGSNSIAFSTAQVTYNAWNHAAATVTDASNRAAFLNGGNKGTSTATPYDLTWANLDSISIGSERDSTPDDGWDGNLAHVAVWNVVLSDAEIALLAKGYPHYMMRPGNLKFYAPLYTALGTSQPEWITGTAGVEAGSPTTEEGPHVWSTGGIIVPRYATSTGPVITDVNTTESWTDGATGLVISGSNFV